MKRRNLAIALCIGLLFFTSIAITQSKRPPKATLSVEITAPSDGIIVEYGDSFIVSGNILVQRGDAGIVDSYIQYSIGEGTSNFNTIDGSTFNIITGEHPQSQNLLQDQSYSVFWELQGSPGTYEIRIYSEAQFAKAGSSDSQTVTIQGPSPPPDIETIDNEYPDPEIGFGKATGSYVNTYFEDGSYEILSEEKNTQGTKKPIDDTTELGWIFEFEDLQERQNTILTIFGHAIFPSDDTDNKFIFKLQSGDTWITILEFRNEDIDRLFSADIPDDTSTSIVLRVVDNDQTLGNKIISSLHIDQLFISYEQTNEFNIADFDGKIGYRGVKIGDVDNDDENEVAVLLNTPGDIGQIRVYEYHSGSWDEEIIVENAVWGWELAIGDVDNDLLNEIAVAFIYDLQGFELKYYKFDGASWTEHNIADPDATTLAVAIGDIDNDGLNEVALGTGHSSGYELRYYKYESGMWREYNIENNLHECDGIEIADIDHDGLNELVYAGMGGLYQVLSYYKFDSGIWTRYDILDPPTSWGIDTGDVDNDGRIEIAWGAYGASADQNEVRVYKLEDNDWIEHIVSDVPGGWTDETHGTDICHVAIGDLDNDGKNELAIGLKDTPTRPSDQTIRFYEFNAGNWIEYNVSDPDTSVEVVEIGDIDNDGKNELLVGLDSTLFELRYYEIIDYQNPIYTTEILTGGGYTWEDQLLIYEGYASGWQNTLNRTLGYYPLDIVITDIDGDLANEVVVAEMCGSLSGDYGTIRIFEYQNNRLVSVYNLTNPSAYGSGIFSIAVGDLDNDGSPYLEIFSSVDDMNGIATIWKKGNNGYYMSYNISQPSASDSVAAGDLDGDGMTELVLSVGLGDPPMHHIFVYENQSGGWEQVASYSKFKNPSGVIKHMEIVDIDRDGINELVVSYSGFGPLHVIKYTEDQLIGFWNSTINTMGGFVTGDATNDGFPDIVVPNVDYINIYEWKSDTIQNTFNVTGYGLFAMGDGVALADIDKDGFNEYIVASTGGILAIFRNDTLLYMKELPYDFPRAVAVGDFDNDDPGIPSPRSDMSTKASYMFGIHKYTLDSGPIFWNKEDSFVILPKEHECL